MTVISGYKFSTSIQDAPIFMMDGRVDLAGLANGGFAAVANNQSVDTTLGIYDPGINVTTAWSDGLNASVGQLANGHVVTANILNSHVHFEIHIVNGPNIEGTLAQTGCAAVDVAGLTGGGFAIAYQKFSTAAKRDILLSLRNAGGAEAAAIAVASGRADDVAPSIAVLDDGGFAVAWHRQAQGQSEMWYAVYNANGSVRKAAALLDTLGTVNRNASVAALDGGGFAIAYEDNGWSLSGDRDISLGRFAAGGSLLGLTDVTGTAANEYLPSLTTLSNGLIAFTASDDAQGGILKGALRLADPETGLIFGPASVYISYSDVPVETAAAGLSLGRVAVFDSELDGAGEVNGQVLQTVRTSIGDQADDIATGDMLADDMQGNGGNDSLNGGANDDTLSGGGGKDSLSGGSYDDKLMGGTGADSLNGGANNDELLGQDNDDVLDGWTGADILMGGAGSDTLTGNAGRDTMNSGGGADIFDFNAAAHSGPTAAARDVIESFVPLQDKIDLSTLDAKSGTAGNQAFSFVGTAAFSAEGQVRAADFGTDAQVEVNIAGHGDPEMRIRLLTFDPATLTAADFVL